MRIVPAADERAGLSIYEGGSAEAIQGGEHGPWALDCFAPLAMTFPSMPAAGRRGRGLLHHHREHADRDEQ